MKYKIVFSRATEISLENIYAFIADENPAAAAKYVRLLRAKCLSLSTLPKRCSKAPENGEDGYEVRHLIHGRYRIIFTITDKVVEILDIRHSARLPLTDKSMLQ